MSELTSPARAYPDPGGRADLVYVLLLLQAALGLLATLGMVLLMGGNPSYAVVPVLHVLALFVLASLVARRRRRAVWFVLVLEALSVVGFALNLLLGLLPQVDMTLNLVGLLTSFGLPVAVLWQCINLLGERSRS